MSYSVACVVVTYNRKHLLIETLTALLAQSTPLDKIYLVDNCSTDGTEAELIQQQLRHHPKIHYQRLEDNTGGAGGFHTGIATALENQHDWIWVMDDDACPQHDALAYLIPHFEDKNTVAVASSVWDTNGIQTPHRGHFHFRRFFPYLQTPLAEEVYTQEKAEINMASFVGLCVRATTAQHIGLPRKAFFIHHDDVEYCLRLNQQGTLYLIPASKILHKDTVSQQKAQQVTRLGRFSQRTPTARLWLYYFTVRNAVYLGKKYLAWYRFIPQLLLYFARQIFGILLYDENKSQRIHTIFRACLDGVLANFSNRFPFQLRRVLAQNMPNKKQTDKKE